MFVCQLAGPLNECLWIMNTQVNVLDKAGTEFSVYKSKGEILSLVVSVCFIPKKYTLNYRYIVITLIYVAFGFMINKLSPFYFFSFFLS